MRFLVDGLDVPEELLTARDEGRVVFFCGAGVSRARANLPDFYGLAEGGLAPQEAEDVDSPSKLLIAEARKLVVAWLV